ncbi:hypothetical protein [Roseimaritima sediminicola]|uniref:hypothetical protein n=1 Tax=Roseimaritima sediminicola TaxID=2662066 RepID=UPI001298467C|nr:hypothetical protein [Roseimaritima sediminicola]
MRTRSACLRSLCTGLLVAACFAAASGEASGQIVAPQGFTARDHVASLEDQLINRLRAAEEQQRGYIRRVTAAVRSGQLESRLVVAIYRYSLLRYPQYPFPYFERAMRYEAGKRGVYLPPVQLIATTPGEARSLR